MFWLTGKLSRAVWCGAWRGAWVMGLVHGIGEVGLGSCLDGEGEVEELVGGVSCKLENYLCYLWGVCLYNRTHLLATMFECQCSKHQP